MHNVWIAAVSYHLAIGALLWHDRSWRKRKNHIDGNSRLLIVLNALIGVFTGVLLYVLWPVLGVSLDFGARLSQMGLTSWLIFGIYYCAVNPITEELFWRRYLAISSRYLAWNDLWFAGYHMLVLGLFVRWQFLPISFALLVFASWIWGRTAGQRNGMLLITASHFFADLGIILVGSLFAGRGM
jgi:hypothetical protein